MSILESLFTEEQLLYFNRLCEDNCQRLYPIYYHIIF